jgi:hypothetical protein
VEQGILLVRQNVRKVQVRLGQPPLALSTTAGQHGRDREFPGPAGPGQFFAAAGDAVQHGGDPDRAGGDVSGVWPVVTGAQVHRDQVPPVQLGVTAGFRIPGAGQPTSRS